MNHETTLSIVYEFLCELSRTNLLWAFEYKFLLHTLDYTLHMG
jgi:hypothetical protein